MQYMKQHYQEDISLGDIAGARCIRHQHTWQNVLRKRKIVRSCSIWKQLRDEITCKRIA
ncbi:MAG: hypothetical protein ACLTSZ_14260 [Lachnospiraceae bacterium]